ncbi:DUF1656 domain-containing protein [Cerasicoccus maritimus]|uniref:DUF1656 domain-containing protein n=1 Tax=Cerasicoccus maritimus TaxID=490089 RepID=UPI0028526889|nr:DUF1656 domain-containing protein [Cerasicoccus maritimus]
MLGTFFDETIQGRVGGSVMALLPDISLNPELDVLGFYVPFSFFIVTLGFMLAWALAWAMDRLGLTRFVWHPPLFLFAMMVGCSAGLGLLLFPR